MAIYEGTTMRIKVGSKTIFHETDAKLSMSREVKELASKDITGKEKILGNYDWNITADTLIANSTTQEDLKTLSDTFIAGSIVAVEFTTDVSGDIIYSGNAYITTLDVDAQNEEAVTGSFAFNGTGALTVGTVA